MYCRLLLLVCIISFVACRNEQSNHKNAEYPNVADSTVSENLQESKDRDIWQNPDYIIGTFGDLTDKTVADLGAGSGYFSFKLLEKAGKVIALDIDKHFIQYMNQKAAELPPVLRNKFEARLVDTNDPKLKENEAQIVLLSNTYIYIQDRINYFKRLRNSLSPGGKLFVVEFKKEKLPVGPPESIKLSAGKVSEELTQAGFSNIKADSSRLRYQYIVMAENLK